MLVFLGCITDKIRKLLWYYKKKWINLPIFEFNLLPSYSVSRKIHVSQRSASQDKDSVHLRCHLSHLCRTSPRSMGLVIFNFVRKTHPSAKIEKRRHFGSDPQPPNQTFRKNILVPRESPGKTEQNISFQLCVCYHCCASKIRY